MGAWQLVGVPLMTALGILFLQAQLPEPGLGLLVLAALIPHAGATAGEYHQWCQQIRKEAMAESPGLAQALAAHESPRAPARPMQGGTGLIGTVTAVAGSGTLEGLAVDAYETRA